MANQSDINGSIEVNFLAGKMNKDFDERIVPPGQYIDALNIRIGSSEGNSVGALENSKGNTQLTDIRYQGNALGKDARCIGSYEDGSNETLYWFICDPDSVDMILSYNTNNGVIIYHIVSTTVLNFSLDYLINGINKVDDLLFWTDNLNPPRKINVTRSYSQPILTVDQITEDDISVIVAPPLEAPSLQLYNQAGEENYITERFISFSYRYKYKDNEYSALSQFSEIAFEPGNFELDFSTYTNKSMQNIFNSVNVSFDTGNKHVIGIDLCFKLSDSNIINVIERYKKSEQGWLDNETRTISFNNRKIYTTLTESELLRLYDNVPRTAKSQTSMGNRLIYGNYVDGYDIDYPLDYSLDVISENINYLELPYNLNDGSTYRIDPTEAIVSNNSTVTIDLDGVDLVEGSLFSMSFSLQHEKFSGYADYDNPPDSPAPYNDFQYDFIFTLRRNYSSVYDLATSTEFVNAVYTHQPFGEDGTSLTDMFNNSLVAKGVFPPFTESWDKVGTGIVGTDGGFTITATPSGTTITIQSPAIKFKIEDPDNLGTYFYAYEYFNNSTFLTSFSKVGARQSLHSNRDYEVAIVYMDEYNRSSTALVDTFNTVFIPASASETKNNIKATVYNIAPEWATRYKFVVKPSKSAYQVVYSNQFYVEDTGLTWFKLEGDNRSKVQDNAILVVKSDTDGVLNSLVKTKILELKSQPVDFISGNKNESEELIEEPAGLYMALKCSNFNAEYKPNSYVNFGEKKTGITTLYPCSIDNPEFDPLLTPGPLNTPYIPYDVPAGSRIKFYIDINRKGTGSDCGSSHYIFEKTFTSSQDYDNLYDFVEGDNIDFGSGEYSGGEEPNDNDQTHSLEPFVNCSDYPNLYVNPSVLSTQTNVVTSVSGLNKYKVSFFGTGTIIFSGAHTGTLSGISNLVEVSTTFYASSSSLVSTVSGSVLNAKLRNISLAIPSGTVCHLPFIQNHNQYQFQINEDTGELWLVVTSGTPSCFSGSSSRVALQITVQRATSLMVFETEAEDADGEIYYEGSDNFAIVNGLHSGNISNQTSTTPAVVDLNFFNCFTFGNGVESYKINDSLIGSPFYLGSRVTAVSQEEFKKADRYAGLTYSGIYNSETNLNKLNEFNLALSNWKDCEKSFGPINKLFARKTDLLVLQEDKISYVLAGKNLLSDAAAGGAIASIPEVLGTQMSRVEDYGISNNPESFASRGSEVFFTDSKRNAVLNLKGSSGANAQSYAGEELAVISSFGLKNWFRDEFKNTFNNQKIGGFDPYMNEYVLSTNNQSLPVAPDVYKCNSTISRQLVNDTYTYDVEVGGVIGGLSVGYEFIEGSANLSVIYDGVEVISEVVTGSGFVNFYKDSLYPDTITVIVECLELSSYLILTKCPYESPISVINITYNSPIAADQTIHNNFNWSLGTFNSVYNVDFVILEVDGVSLYHEISGMPSVGVIPAIGSIVKMQSNKLSSDDFIFDETRYSFKYLVSNTLYSEGDANIITPLLTTCSPILNPATGRYESSFVYDNPLGAQYLYMVWDYREPDYSALDYSPSDYKTTF